MARNLNEVDINGRGQIFSRFYGLQQLAKSLNVKEVIVKPLITFVFPVNYRLK